MDLENLGQSAAELNIAFETLKEQIRNNAQLLSQLTGDAARGFEASISKTKKLTDALSTANKQSLSNYKERLQFESKLQRAQKELVGLTRQRDILISRLSIATREERIQLLALIDNYNNLIYSSQELVDNTKKLKEELQPINDNLGTKLLGSVSDLASKIPGISRFSGPFKEASEAAEKMATQNQLIFGSVNGISKAQLESLKTGRGLSAEFAKQLGLVDRNGNALRGAAAANRARTLGITAAAEASMSPLMAGIKSLGPALVKAFGPMFIIFEMVKALIKADTATGDLAKEFNLTYDEAANVRNELIQIGNLSGNIALNARALQESMVAVGKALGSNAMLNQADLETFTELREMAGYTNEELVDIQKLTLATGGNLKDNTKQFLGTVSALNAQNKLTVNEKQLLKEVAKTSAAIKLSIGGTTKDLAAAAFQAKQFGINLEQADRIAESLLNFEESITAELSAELLTGKDLNLERARLLALNGDIAGASAEILKQVKGSAEFTKMNRIQQEALARAVGMSREDLAASLIEREALQKIGVKDAAAAKERFDLLVKQYGYDKAVTMLGDEQYATQLKQQSIQERMNMAIEKMQELFVGIAEPILQIISPFVDVLLPVVSLINLIIGKWMSMFGSIGGYITKMLGPLTAVGKILKTIAGLAVVYAAYQAYASAAAVPVLGAGVGAIISAAILTAGFGFLNSIKDGVIDLKKGPIMTGEFGSVQLNPADKAMYGADGTIKVGTNLEGKKSSSPTNTIIQQPIDYDKLASAINNRPTIIENSINGNKFGTAVAQTSYKISPGSYQSV
jgi:hypothetical protein